MTLTEWSATTKRTLFQDLLDGSEPRTGTFDATVLKEGRTLGKPQMGATVYQPDSARFEFVFSGMSNTIVFSVAVKPPEDIVFLPVPSWVIESIWQGDIDGSFHFRSDALRLLDEFRGLLELEANRPFFGRKQATRRE